MDPLRLQLFLTLAVQMAGLSPALATAVFLCAWQHLTRRWPLAGCMVQGMGEGLPRVVVVGLQ